MVADMGIRAVRTGFILQFKGSAFYFSHVLNRALTLSLEMKHAWFTEDEAVAQGMAVQLKQFSRYEFELVPYVHEER